jgi:hypothetical protein
MRSKLILLSHILAYGFPEVCVWFITMSDLAFTAASIRSVKGYELAGKGKLQN